MKQSKRAKRAQQQRGFIAENKLSLYYDATEINHINAFCCPKERHHNWSKRTGWHYVNYYDPDEIARCLQTIKDHPIKSKGI